MDSKTLHVLEYHKILERLAAFCDFSASMDLARALEPTNSYELALSRLAETTEASNLLAVQDISIGGAHDIRPQADLAARGGVLDPHAFLDIHSTLISCREIKKSLEKKNDEYPRLAQLAVGLPETFGLVDSISRMLSDRGEVLDSASLKLAGLRREIRVAHGRLMTRLQKYVTEFGFQIAGADHHPTRWALRHSVARGIQGKDQVHYPRSILERRDVVRGTAAGCGTQQSDPRTRTCRTRRRTPHPGRTLGAGR